MRLLISIPAYNEEKTIADVIKSIPSHIEGVDSIEILVINDGSSDATREHALSAGTRVISHAENLGLSRTFQKGVHEALIRHVDIMVNIDADGQFDGQDIPRLINPIIKNEADFVAASRFIDKSLVPTMPKLKRWGNKKVSQLISFIAGRKFYDVSCGFRAYSKEALLHLNLFGKYSPNSVGPKSTSMISIWRREPRPLSSPRKEGSQARLPCSRERREYWISRTGPKESQ